MIKELENIFQSYLNEIDDFYEAKELFLNDLNKMFKKHGDNGVICKEKFIEVFNNTKELI